MVLTIIFYLAFFGWRPCRQPKKAISLSLSIYFGVLISVVAYGQEGFAGHRTLVLRDSNLTMKVQVLNTSPAKLKLSNKLTYYYHHKNGIHQSQGGYAGSLLDGTWESHFPSNLLSSQGIFEDGLKSDTWRYWYPNGRLQREEHWKKGRLHGSFTEFASNGLPAKQGCYRHGLLHGTVKTLEDGAVVEKSRYRHGKITKWFVFPKLFKRKNPQTDETPG